MLGFELLTGSAVKGTIVLAIAAAAVLGLRRRSAAARHLVWTGAAAALLAIPVLTATLPALRVPVVSDGTAAAFFQVVARGGASAPAQVGSVGTAPAGGSGAAAAQGDWRRRAVAVWAIGASIGVLQMLLACGAVWRLRRKARRVEVEDAGDVEVLESDRSTMPMTFGVLRPVVMLPAGASEWRAERLRVVLLHELAHVRRGDVATHLMARAALAVYWWNPLMWFAWRKFLEERERATDDLVLHAGERASEYATHLLEVARTFEPAPTTAWAALSMARRSQLEGRLVAILDGGVSRRPWGRRAQAAAVAVALAVSAPFAAMQAQDTGVPPEAEATIRAALAQKNYEILDRAAAAYEKVAQFAVARRLLETSVAIREQAGTAAYAAGLVKLADLAIRRGQTDEAIAFFTKAVSLGDRPEVAEALTHLGARALGAGDRATAEDFFRRALRVAPTGQNAGRTLMWLAVMRGSQVGGEADAERLYLESLELAPDAPQTLINYSALLRRMGRTAEAVELQRRREAVLEAAVNSRQAFKVGNGVTAPGLLYKVEPEYTEEARAAKYQGTVLLYVEIDPDGMAQNIAVRRSLGLGLDEKAIEAVRRWKFKPGTKDGVAVTVQATIEVNFRLI